MARKVFISFLGGNNYGACHYVRDDFKSPEVRYIQEATLDYYQAQEQWTAQDVAYILLTKGAEKLNWLDDGHRDRNTGEIIKQNGLKTVLESKCYPFQITPVKNLPDGNNEDEIFEIFMRVFNELQEGDHLYFDITHGFRYLPMLVLVMCNYARFLRHTKVISITYGNYEARDKEKKAPIIDLLPLTAIQEWTYATGQYLDTGNVSLLTEISKAYLKPILREAKGKDANATTLNKFISSLSTVVDERRFCRGIDIVKSTNLSALQKYSEVIDSTIIKPLSPVIDKVKETLPSFDTNENVMNGFMAAKWCVGNGLYQQAATILEENIITLLCTECGFNWQVEAERSYISRALNILSKNISEEDWDLRSKTVTEEDVKANIKHALSNEHMSQIKQLFIAISDVRNDYNHSGMRNNPMSPSSIGDKIKKHIDKVLVAVVEWGYKIPKDEKNNKDSEVKATLINLTNHPYDQWSEKQKEAASTYGECVDMPFPSISPELTEGEIQTIADDLLRSIIEQYPDKKNMTIHLMGEFTLTYALLQRFRQEGITCIASCTQRNVTVTDDGVKHVFFDFVRFREYQ